MNTAVAITALAVALAGTAHDGELSPEVLVELVHESVATEVFAGIAQEPVDNCKEAGKTWVRAVKYAWFAAIGIAEIVCCTGGTLVGCAVCTGFATTAAAAGDDIADDYCG
jgi:hypothetical protein